MSLRHFLSLLTLLTAITFYLPTLQAQGLQTSPRGNKPLDEQQFPELPTDSDENPSLSVQQQLPALPPPSNNPPLSAIAKVFVQGFVIEGNQVFSDAELQDVIQPYTNRIITAEELLEAKNQVTLHYVNTGYINSGAILPDQQVVDGMITLKVIEGTLADINIGGQKRLRESYIRSRLELPEGSALNLNTLQEKLQLIQQNPLFQRINAELAPGVSLGEGILNVQVTENRPYEVGFRFNNHRSPSIGSYRGELFLTHRNLTGWGDRIYARYGITEGLDDYALEYSLPINRHDTTLSLFMERSSSEVISEPFNELDVKSDADT